MRAAIIVLAVLALAGCDRRWNSDGFTKPGDASWRGVIKTLPDADGVVCYKYESGGISCVKVK